MHEDTRTIHAAWSVFADALEASAGEHHLSFMVFSLPKFINFLVNGHVHDPNSFLVNRKNVHDSNSSLHHVVQAPDVDVVGNAAVFLSHGNTAGSSAPGASSSRAGSGVFVRAAQDNAQNPILHATLHANDS